MQAVNVVAAPERFNASLLLDRNIEQGRAGKVAVHAVDRSLTYGELLARASRAGNLLHALGACLMSGLGNIAAARGIELDEVAATIEGDIDLRGLLGLDPAVRNGFQGIRVTFHVKGAAEAEKLAAVVRQSQSRSAVYDVLTNGVPVRIDVAG